MKKKIANVVLLLVLITGTLYFLLRDQELDDLWACIVSADKGWLITGLALTIAFVCLESVIINYLLNILSHPINIWHCIKYSFIGFFISAITPSSTGGQPAQAFFMKQDGISVSISSLVLMVVTITYKMALLLLAFIVMIINKNFVLLHLKGIEFIICYGILVNVITIVLMMILVFKQSLAKRICGKVLLFLGNHGLIHNPDEKIKKMLASISKYDNGAKFLKTHKIVFLNAFAITIVQRLFYFFVTYVVYRSFGLNQCNPLEIVTLQIIINLAVDFLPWPGGLGVNEGIFLVFFTEIFTEHFVTAGLMLSRGLTYYFIILSGGLVTMFSKFLRRRHDKRIQNTDVS